MSLGGDREASGPDGIHIPDAAEAVAGILLDTARGWCLGPYPPSATDLSDGRRRTARGPVLPSLRNASAAWTSTPGHGRGDHHRPGVSAAAATAVVARLYAQPEREPALVEALGGLTAAVPRECNDSSSATPGPTHEDLSHEAAARDPD